MLCFISNRYNTFSVGCYIKTTSGEIMDKYEFLTALAAIARVRIVEIEESITEMQKESPYSAAVRSYIKISKETLAYNKYIVELHKVWSRR